jgi:hypothetical protein
MFKKVITMFLNRRTLVALAVCVCLSATSVFASSNGGTKKDCTIKVTNNSDAEIGVAVNPSKSLLTSTTPEEFVARGGKILQPGDTYTVKVKAGTQRVIVVDYESSEGYIDQSVAVSKGQVKEGFVTRDDGDLELNF